MSNELTLQGLANNLVSFRQSMPQSGGATGFMKMGKDGVWSYGVDGTVPHAEGIWLANPHTFGHGWIAWNDGRPENEVYKLLNQPLPPPSSLPPVVAEKGWEEERGVVLVCIKGPDDGEQVTFKSNSRGGIDAVGALADAVIEALNRGDGKVFPAVLLRNTSYKHAKYGKIFKPVFEIVGWHSGDPERGREPEPEPEPVGAAEAPRAVNGRRRRPNLA